MGRELKTVLLVPKKGRKLNRTTSRSVVEEHFEIANRGRKRGCKTIKQRWRYKVRMKPGLIRLMMTKRDLELVLEMHEEKGKELNDMRVVVNTTNEEKDADVVLGVPTQPVVRSFSQDLKDPNYVYAFHDLGRKVDLMVAMRVDDAPSFDLGIDNIGCTSHQHEPQHAPLPPHPKKRAKITQHFVRRSARIVGASEKTK